MSQHFYLQRTDALALLRINVDEQALIRTTF